MDHISRTSKPRWQASMQPKLGRSLNTGMKEKEEELALFLEVQKREREQRNSFLLHSPDDLDTSLGSGVDSSPIFKLITSSPLRRTAADDFLNSEGEKTDYDWLLTPPGTPLFPSLEAELSKSVLASQSRTPKPQPSAVRSRLGSPQTEQVSRGNVTARPNSSPGLSSLNTGPRRPSSSGGSGIAGARASRPPTPTGRPAISSTSKSTRSATPSSRPSLSSSKPSPQPTKASTARPRSSTPTSSSASRSSANGTISAAPAPKSASRSATPSKRPSAPSSGSRNLGLSNVSKNLAPSNVSKNLASKNLAPSNVSKNSGPSIVSKNSGPSNGSKNLGPPRRSASVSKAIPSRDPSQTRGVSPTVKSRSWKPSEIPGFTSDVPPNLRTSLPERPISISRGRLVPPRSSSVEPSPSGRPRRQSCSPTRGRVPNGSIHRSGSSGSLMNKSRLTTNDNPSPVVMGNRMVERVINMRKLAPLKQEDQKPSGNNATGKSVSADSSGFGRTLSKKSLDMALRHMDIRSIPGNLRTLMTNIPASSMYSIKSTSSSRRTNISGSPIATSSNCSSDHSISNNNLCTGSSEIEDEIGSERGEYSSSSSQLGR